MRRSKPQASSAARRAIPAAEIRTRYHQHVTFLGRPLLAVLVLVAGCAHRVPGPATVDIQLLAFNDFHGALEPPAGANGRIGQTPAGGVEYLATHLRSLAATNPNTVIVSAGDNIGATPLLSGMFHDEPSIEALNATGVRLSAVGNHELDEGWGELVRMQKGGCHPADGCQDETPFNGASFRFLAANILVDPARVDRQVLRQSGWKGTAPGSLFPPYAVERIGGVKVGFIGLTLRGAPSIVSPQGITGLTFQPEPAAANAAAAALRRQGVNAIVVLIHEGGTPRGEPGQEDPSGCEDFSGPIVDIAKEMSPSIDVVVSGHTHRAYVCTIASKLVTSAASLSRLITDIDLRVDRASGRVVGKTARNVTVTRDVAKTAGETAVIEHYLPLAASVASKPVGTATAPIPMARNAAGESALGDIIADGMLEAARAAAGDVDFAFTNPGGIRSDLVPSGPAAAGNLGTITYNDVFNVLPFGNVVVVRTMTGDAIVRMLEEQFGEPLRVLQMSTGVTYAWDATKPAGSRINRDSIRINGEPLVPTRRYRMASVDFLWNGGDAFLTAAKEATDPVGVGADVDVFLGYLGRHSPVAPGPQDRIRREH